MMTRAKVQKSSGGAVKRKKRGLSGQANPFFLSEAQIQRSICDLLDLVLPGLYSVTDASRTWSKSGLVRKSKVRQGWPDLTGCLPGGRMFAVEVKKPGGRLKAGQKESIQALVRSGAAVLVAFSLDQVYRWLKEIVPAKSDAGLKLARIVFEERKMK